MPVGEKSRRMAVSVDETFPQGRVGMNRTRKTGTGGGAIRERTSENEEGKESSRTTARKIKRGTMVKR